MFEHISTQDRIERAKIKVERVLDNFLFILKLHANNKITTYSTMFAGQIANPYAADAFWVIRKALHEDEIVRLCTLWDSVDIAKANIPTIINLIDDPAVIHSLAEEAHRLHANDPDFRLARHRRALAVAEMSEAINYARDVLASDLLPKIMNLRDKYLAHLLEITRREERDGPIQPMQYGEETALINATTPIIERLHRWLNGAGFSIADAIKTNDAHAQALWHNCKFTFSR